MATIDTNVPVELDVEAMRAGEPAMDALRELFTELEFTSLLKELLPVVQVTDSHYDEAKSVEDLEKVLNSVADGYALAVAIERADFSAPSVEEEIEADTDSDTNQDQGSMLLPLTGGSSVVADPVARLVAISAAPGTATVVRMDSTDIATKLRAALTNASVPKTIHDYKAALHAFDALGISLEGVRHDSMLYSYLLDPSYSSQRLPDVALRRFNLKLSGDLAEAADIAGRLAVALHEDVEGENLLKLYEEVDLPLVPVLTRMEQAGVKIDTAALAKMSTELEREITTQAKAIHQVAGMEFNVGSPKQLGDVLFNRMNLPKPVKYGKGRTISTAVDVLEELAENHPIASLG